MQFNDLLRKEGIDPANVLVMRHQPYEKELRKHFFNLAIKQPQLFNSYQSSQASREEKQLAKAEYLAAFVGHTPGKATFIGLYQNLGNQPITHEQYWSDPTKGVLRQFGMNGFIDERPTILHFDLQVLPFYAKWKGRLIIDWPGGERSWSRWASMNDFSVDAIREEGGVEPPMPEWNDLCVSWLELKSLWQSWQLRLAEWRGIYFIFDRSDGKGYVGSAYGEQNILGRWTNYIDSGHGGNKGLKSRSPENFIFSVLERVSPDMAPDMVIELENRWKKRLSTVSHGLNEA